MMISTDAAIARIALGVIDRTLPKRDWTHAAHFAAALWLYRHRPDLAAPQGMRTLISRYNDATLTANTDSGGYHHTITCASMRAVAHYLERYAPEAPLHRVLTALMASRPGHPEWLLDHWHRATLFSVLARRAWVEPDRQPLPF
ncbi:hypothetical protein [Sphingomonas sp. DC1100-1]|uniref:hypothetical protein n=1 Tax=unclassified Sphingomonas TaxID=196159 RepID=UPI003CE7B70D